MNSTPQQITNLTATLNDTIGVVEVSALISWTDPNNESGGCLIERTRSSDANCDTFIMLTTTPAGTNSYLDTALTHGAVYRYKVTAQPVLPFPDAPFVQAKAAEIQVQTAGQPVHIIDTFPQGTGGNSGLTYQGSMVLVQDGSWKNGTPAN